MSNTELSSEAQTHICQLSAQFLHLDCSKVFNKPETKFRGTTSQTWSLSRIPPLRELAEYVRKLAVLLDIFLFLPDLPYTTQPGFSHVLQIVPEQFLYMSASLKSTAIIPGKNIITFRLDYNHSLQSGLFFIISGLSPSKFSHSSKHCYFQPYSENKDQNL